jgi:ABC-type transport system involved in cytochrome c biogenesis permease subunit
MCGGIYCVGMAWLTDRHFFLLAVGFYGLAVVHSVFLWRTGFRKDNHVNFVLLLAGFALHTTAMFKRGFSLNACPVNNLYEAILFLLWALALACLAIGWLPRLKFLGAFASPVLFAVGVFALMPSLDPPHGPKPDFSNWLTSLHAATILLAYGAFGLGAVACGMFLLQRRKLKAHKVSAVLSVFPSIQRLEATATGLVLAGFILFTIGLVAGYELPQPSGAGYFSDSKVIWSALFWLVYLELQVAHRFFGRSSRNFAGGVIISFVLLLLTFWITNLNSPLHHP